MQLETLSRSDQKAAPMYVLHRKVISHNTDCTLVGSDDGGGVVSARRELDGLPKFIMPSVIAVQIPPPFDSLGLTTVWYP